MFYARLSKATGTSVHDLMQMDIVDAKNLAQYFSGRNIASNQKSGGTVVW